jgi:hypothetical protein
MFVVIYTYMYICILLPFSLSLEGYPHLPSILARAYNGDARTFEPKSSETNFQLLKSSIDIYLDVFRGTGKRLASCFQRRRLPQDVSKLLPLNPICASNSDDSIYATSTTYRKRSTPVTSTSNLLMPCQSCFSIEECYKRNTL